MILLNVGYKVTFMNILLTFYSAPFDMALRIFMFTISSRKYFPMYFALGPMVCQFTHMNKPHFYLAFQLPCLDEWKEKPLGTLGIQMRLKIL